LSSHFQTSSDWLLIGSETLEGDGRTGITVRVVVSASLSVLTIADYYGPNVARSR
jgi:hypothetical protein